MFTNHLKNIEVLHDVSLQVDAGSICGIIGRNGSGKTVLFKCICGFLQTDRGEIQIEGKAVGKDKSTLSNLGIIIESPGFLRHYSGYKNLEFLMGLNGKADREKINAVLDWWALRSRRIKKSANIPWGCARDWELPSHHGGTEHFNSGRAHEWPGQSGSRRYP